MKKLLMGLMGVTLIAPTLTVVACGTSGDPEGTYRIDYTYPVGNWNTAHTMHSEDHQVLANTNATPLASDPYGRIFGDIFEVTNDSYGKDNPYIGKHNDDFTEFTYKVRSNATWSDYKGKKVASLVAGDFLNSAKYALNATNGSEVISIWTSFIVGSDEIYTASQAEGADFDAVWEANKSKLGVVVDESANTVTFKLKKSASYFETLLTYSIFSPIYKEAVTNPLVSTDYRKGFYSGAYLPTSYVNSGNIILDKNPNYHLKDETLIQRLKYVFISGGADRTRTLFESGGLDKFNPSPSDKAGWDKYIGNWESPNETAGLAESKSPNISSSMLLFFNLYNSDVNSTNANTSQRAVIASRVLQNPIVRKFIASNLERTRFVSYYSSAYDNGANVSKMLRNTYTPDFIESNGKDYVEFLTDALQENEKFSSVQDGDLVDGKDFFYGNEEFAGGALSDQIASINAYFESDSKIKSYLASNNKIQIQFPLNPNHQSTLNPKLLDMFAAFNSISGNKIEIVSTPNIATVNDYQDITNGGSFDISTSGWSADYADPFTYLSTVRIGGDLENNLGTNRLYPKLTSASDLDADSSKWEAVKEDVNEKLLVETDDVTKNNFESLAAYSKQIKLIDETESEDKRMADFAEQEVELIYENAIFLPMYTQGPPKSFSIGYITPYTNSTSPYGLGQYRYWGVEINKNLLSYAKIQELKAIFEKNSSEVALDPNTHKDSIAWA